MTRTDMAVSAVAKVMQAVVAAGHQETMVQRIGVIFVQNKETGPHCHATASIRQIFDVVVRDEPTHGKSYKN